MKKFYLLLALLVAVNVQFSEALPYRLSKVKEDRVQTTLPKSLLEKLPEVIDNGKSQNSIQSLNYGYADTLSRATFMTWSNIVPMAYDQYNDTYYYSAVRYVINAQGNISATTNLIKKSNDGGMTWSGTPYNYTVDGEIMGYTSIGVANPSKSSSGMTNFVAYTPSYKPNAGSYTLDGGYLFISDGENQDRLPLIRPDENSTGVDNRFGITTSMIGYSNGDNSYIAGTNQMFPAEGQQYGLIGQFTMEVPNFTGSSQIPRQWWLDKFFPSTAVGSTFNTFGQIDNDSEGNLYSGVYNRFVNAPDNRVPGVSKSTDKGATWSEFNTMPVSIFDDYWVSLGFPANSAYTAGGYGIMPYRIDGFVVYGNDNYSYFFRVAKFVEGTQNEIELCHLVEANYNGTNWRIRKVADLETSDLPDQILDNPAAAQGAPYELLIQGSSLGNEIHATKTADGQHIVLKWIDIKPGGPFPLSISESLKVEQTNPNTGADEIVTLNVDSINTTDIYFAYRKVNENTWSNPINVSNDLTFDKGTFIPKLVKDVNNIVMSKTETINRSYNGVNLMAKDPLITQRVIDLQQYIRTTKINLNDPNLSVETREENKFDFRLNEIYPNPALNGSVEITFSAENTQNGRLELYDALGNKIQTIFDGVIENTIQGMNFSTVNLNNGVYFVTLTIGDKSLTKKFNVLN